MKKYVTKNKDGRHVSSHPYFKALIVLPEEELKEHIEHLFTDENTYIVKQKWDRTVEFINEFNAVFKHSLLMNYLVICSDAEEVITRFNMLARARTADEVDTILTLLDNISYKEAISSTLCDISISYGALYSGLINLAEFIMDSVKYAKESLQ